VIPPILPRHVPARIQARGISLLFRVPLSPPKDNVERTHSFGLDSRNDLSVPHSLYENCSVLLKCVKQNAPISQWTRFIVSGQAEKQPILYQYADVRVIFSTI